MSFRKLPLTWKLRASHPEIKVLERSARREIFFYGFLLTVIVALMLFGAVMIARDISRESETNRLKTEFVNNISHELKTPLAVVQGTLRILKRKIQGQGSSTELKGIFDTLEKHLGRLLDIQQGPMKFSAPTKSWKSSPLTKKLTESGCN